MSLIEKISNNLAIILKENLNFDEEKFQVIEYGIHAFIHMMFSILVVVIFGLLFNVLLESLIISFTISLFRKASGGAHAETELNCALIGMIVSVIPAIIITKYNIELRGLLVLITIFLIVSFILTIKLAPVDSPNKPIKSEKKIKRLKKESITTLVIYMILIIINILLSKVIEGYKGEIYGLCIAFGTLWQSFTLTKVGHKLFYLFDSLLKTVKREE